MARGKAHSDEVRAQVIAALMAGQGVMETAAEYNLAESTVRSLGKGAGVEFAELRAKKGEELNEKIYGYLSANLQALKAQCEVAGDPVYLKRQPGSELATLHGVMADKAFKIMEAANTAKRQAAAPKTDDAEHSNN